MTNLAKFGLDKPLEGGSTAIFACNHAKPRLNMFSDQNASFFDPGEIDLKQKSFFHYTLLWIGFG